jgi:hypothetical protein
MMGGRSRRVVLKACVFDPSDLKGEEGKGEESGVEESG